MWPKWQCKRGQKETKKSAYHFFDNFSKFPIFRLNSPTLLFNAITCLKRRKISIVKSGARISMTSKTFTSESKSLKTAIRLAGESSRG